MKNFSGLTITGATPDGYSVKANGYVKGSWLQSSVMQNYGSNTGKVCVFDGAGWIYYRTPAEIVAEAGGGNGYTQLTNEDLNTITEAGWYYANANHSCTNTPASISAFWLEVSAPLLNSSSSTVIRQTLHAINYLPATSFVRESVNNKFASSWYQLEQMDKSTGQKIVGTKTFVDGISLGSALRIQTSTNVGTGGTAGQVLTSTGPYSAPQWKAPSGSNTTVDSPMVNGVSYTVFGSGEYGSFIGTFATEADETGMTITVGSTSYVLTETRQAINYRLTIDKNDQFVYSTIVVDGGIADKISSFSTVPSDGIVKISTNLSSSYMESNRCVIIKE